MGWIDGTIHTLKMIETSRVVSGIPRLVSARRLYDLHKSGVEWKDVLSANGLKIRAVMSENTGQRKVTHVGAEFDARDVTAVSAAIRISNIAGVNVAGNVGTDVKPGDNPVTVQQRYVESTRRADEEQFQRMLVTGPQYLTGTNAYRAVAMAEAARENGQPPPIPAAAESILRERVFSQAGSGHSQDGTSAQGGVAAYERSVRDEMRAETSLANRLRKAFKLG